MKQCVICSLLEKWLMGEEHYGLTTNQANPTQCVC